MQTELLRILLDNTDATSNSSSTRKIFLQKFRVFLHENILSRRVRSCFCISYPLYQLNLCFPSKPPRLLHCTHEHDCTHGKGLIFHVWKSSSRRQAEPSSSARNGPIVILVNLTIKPDAAYLSAALTET